MSNITTNLNRRAYFDDYNENKMFYRVLIKASLPVQTRELNQIQTILQKQISRFGSHVFRNGSIVDGVNPSEVLNAYVVRVKNSYSNSSTVDVDLIEGYSNNMTLVSQTTGLEAKFITVKEGSEANAPETKRLYVTYPTVDESQTRTSSGSLAITSGSNTVTGTSTSFTTYSVGDVVTIFEEPSQTKVSFNATIESIANNTSMNLSRALTFANTGIVANNFVVTNKITAFGQVGSDASPEILDLVTQSVLNTQSNTVNTAATSNTFNLDFTAANTSLLEVRVNGELQKTTIDYTPTVSDITFKVDLTDGDLINIIEKQRTTAFSGLRCYSESLSGIVTSEQAIVVRNEDGIVYHKGHFLNIDAGFSIVSDNLIGANSAQVVVRTDETIVTYKSDSSLLDNADGFANHTAPGADRLKLVPTLANANTANLNNQDAAAVIFEFNDRGQARVINDDPQYAELGKQLAIRKDETAGSFTINEFEVDTEATSNNSTMNIVVDSGTGYVNGFRVETQAPTRLEIDRSITTTQFEDIETVMTQGNAIRVHGLVGNFVPHYDLDFIKVTSGGGASDMFSNSDAFSTFVGGSSGSVPTGTTRVGRGIVKSVELVSGTPGSNTAVYDIALYDVVAEAGEDLSTARSVSMRRDATGFALAATAAADITLLGGEAALRNSDLLPFSSFGEEAMKQYTDGAGAFDNSWTVRKHSRVTDTFNANGYVVIDVDDESDFSYTKSIGAYTDSEKNNVVLVNVGSEISCNAAGPAASVSNTTITVPSATSGYIHVGDTLQIGSGAEVVVTAITNTTTVEIDTDLGSTSGVLNKIIPVGKVIPLDSDMITTNQVDNTMAVHVPTLNNGNYTSTTTVVATYEFNTTDVKPAEKTIRKDRYFAFNTANNSAGPVGPWQIGSATDVHKVTGIYILSNGEAGVTNTTATTGDLASVKNYVDGEFFVFDSGQRDFFYDYAEVQITAKGLKSNILSANNTVVVKYDHFEINEPDGTGYFSIDSYPTTTENSANSTTILLEEVPVFITSTGDEIDLRNVIDHRPVRQANTYSALADALSNADVVGSRVNVNNNGFPVTFKNDSEFVSDYQTYNSKRVDIYLQPDTTVTTSSSKRIDILPPVINTGMKIGSVGVPALPSLTSKEAFDLSNTKTGGRLADRRTKFETEGKENEVDAINIRGWTMRDIGVLAERIENLEYYASLNALEADIFNKQFKNSSGIERFKNGIFVDPFVSHQFGQISNPDYAASIDEDFAVLRPPFDEEVVQRLVPSVQSGDIVRKNQKVLFDYTETELVKQDKATKVRPAAPLAIRYNADVYLFPEYDVGTSRSNRQTVTARSRVRNIRRRRGNRNTNGVASNWGRWRTVRPNRRNRNFIPRTPAPTSTGGTVNLGQFVSNVSVSPFIRSIGIGFIAVGLRPNTIHSIFFNRTNVDAHVVPGSAQVSPAASAVVADLALTTNTTITSTTLDTSRPAMSVITPVGRVGDPVVSDGAGTAQGIFFVPTNTFLQGDRELLVADIKDLVSEEDAILSSGAAMFYSNRIGVQFRSVTPPRPPVPPRQPRRRTRRDPIAQTFYIGAEASSNVPGVIFMTSIDLFFKTKGTNPVLVYLCEVENGQPDSSRIIPGSQVRVQAADINLSNDGSSATRFTFGYPIKLNRDDSYAFVVKPDLDDPDFDVFFAELGAKDLITGTGVNSQPSIGVAFLGSNQDTWSAIQDEDIKFTLNRASFVTGTGSVRFTPNSRDYVDEFEDITYINGYTDVRVGDFVIGMTSANTDPAVTVANCNTSIFGIIDEIDSVNSQLTINPTQGLINTSSAKVFSTTLRDGTTRNTTKYKLAIYRPVDQRTEIGTLNQDRFVGSTFGVIGDHEFSTIVPQFTTDTFANNAIEMDFIYNVSNTVTQTIEIPTEGEVDYTPQPLLYRSKTRDQQLVASGTGGTSFVIDASMTNASEYTSPVIDLRRSMVTLVGNLTTSPDTSNSSFITGASIDDVSSASIFSEMFQGAGESNVRYISEVITLDEDQDAEDLKIFLSAFKPPRSRVDVFVRAAHRFEDINVKPYSPMKLVNDTVYSDRNNQDDIKELEYRMHTQTEMAATNYYGIFGDTGASDYAYHYTSSYTANSLISTNDSTGIAEYESGGNTYTSYKYFQIKIVMYATVDGVSGYGSKRSSNPPVLHDVRAIAMQV